MKRTQLSDFRCPNCHKLLAKFNGLIEVKCPRCKQTFNSNANERLGSGDADGLHHNIERLNNSSLQ